jgi:signal transduction histidine kinase
MSSTSTRTRPITVGRASQQGGAPMSGIGRRFMALGYAFASMMLAIPALVMFVLEVTFIPLTIITIGIFALQGIVPATAGVAAAHRKLASVMLRRPVESFYKPTAGLGVLGRLQRWGGDSARWRDLAGMFVSSTVGFTLSLLAIVLFLSPLWYFVYPFIWWVTPEGVFDTDLGFMYVDTLEETFVFWIIGLVFALVWWYGIVPMMRLRAGIDAAILSRTRTEQLERRVADLSASRAESVDHSAAELRRIERDLHDGAQARLVALGMSLGMADDLLQRDPEAARQLLAEARSTTTAALGDLRSVVRGIHPPVLADRGLVGALRALALDMPIPVLVAAHLSGRPPAPVESAVYFAVAECFANIGKHSDAQQAWIEVEHVGGVLRVEVGDDGHGGADVAAGTGMRGVMRRLATFDGTMTVSSPVGGPTVVTMKVPCTMSPAKSSS